MGHGRRTIVGALAIALVLGACSSDAGPIIETEPVTAGEVVQTVAAPARLEPRARRTVLAPSPAEVTAILVEDGQRVEEGTPIIRLESDAIGLAVAQASAAVDAVRALAGVSLTPDLSPVVGTLRAQFQSTVDPIIATLSAQANAIEDPALREQALAAVTYLKVSYEETRALLLEVEGEARQASARSNATQRQAVEAQKQQAEAALAAAEAQEDSLVLLAPASGVVELGRISGGGDALGSLLGGVQTGSVAVGSVVVPGQPVFTVYDLDGYHIVANIDEIDVVLVDTGQRTSVFIDAFPDLTFDGVVRKVAISPDTTPTGGVVYPIEVELRGMPADLSLRVGLTASVEIVVATVETDTIIPSASLRRRDGGEAVVVVRDGQALTVPVQVEAVGDAGVAVSGDLQPGDRVVVTGADDLEDGDVVDAS